MDAWSRHSMDLRLGGHCEGVFCRQMLRHPNQLSRYPKELRRSCQRRKPTKSRPFVLRRLVSSMSCRREASGRTWSWSLLEVAEQSWGRSRPRPIPLPQSSCSCGDWLSELWKIHQPAEPQSLRHLHSDHRDVLEGPQIQVRHHLHLSQDWGDSSEVPSIPKMMSCWSWSSRRHPGGRCRSEELQGEWQPSTEEPYSSEGCSECCGESGCSSPSACHCWRGRSEGSPRNSSSLLELK